MPRRKFRPLVSFSAKFTIKFFTRSAVTGGIILLIRIADITFWIKIEIMIVAMVILVARCCGIVGC